LEVSDNSLIYNNLVIITRETGIYISGSNDTRCFNNTVVGTTDMMGIALGGVPREGCTLKNNRVFDNIVSGSTNAKDLIIPQDNGGDTEGNTSDYNCFFRPDGILKLSNGIQTYSSLETWRAATGFDLHSISADPRFNLTTTDDYSTCTTSPVVDAGMTLPEVTTDILGQPRPQGAASDMGAYETYWHDTEPPTTPPGVAAALVTWNSVRVTWNPASDNIGVDCYQVYRDGVLCADTPGTEFLDTGLAALTTYRYHVIAIDGAGLKSKMSDVIAILTGPLPESLPPSIPQKLSAITKTAWEVTLAWKAATDNVGVTEYWIYRNGRKVGAAGSTGFTDAGLKPSMKYSYQVSALDAAGNESKLSKSLAVKTLPAPVLTVIEQWRLDHFGTSSDSGDAADAFDFDQDGNVNFAEYALGRNPTSSLGDDGPVGMPDPELDVAADRLVLVIDLPDPTPAEVLYEVLATEDLVNWTRIAQKAGTAAWVRMDSDGTIVQDPVVAGRQITRVQDSVSMTAHSRRMMTLRLSGLP
jgi:chitodextrinase